MIPYLRIGCIVRAHGVHGALKINPETNDIKRFQKLSKVYLESNESYSEIKVSNVKLQNDAVIISVEGVDTVEKAEELRGRFICVNREEAVVLPEHSYFITDLMDSTVIGTNHECYGKITDVYPGVAQDVYILDNGKKSFPALKKLILSFDAEKNEMIVDSEVMEEVCLYED